MNAYRDAYSFREIDAKLGLPKGSAFRIFKRIEAKLEEGLDYFLLRADEDREAIDHLRTAGRIYASSRNVVMLSATTRDKVLTGLNATVGGQE